MFDLFRKWYKLHLTVNGVEINIYRHFRSRYDAVEFAMKHYPMELSIQHRNRMTKHFIEYYIDDHNRFCVERILKK